MTSLPIITFRAQQQPHRNQRPGCLFEAATATPEHGRGPRERAVLLAQQVSIQRGPTPASAAQRARAAHAFCVTSLSRACGSAFACAHTLTPAVCRRPRLARRSTGVHRGREPSRWRSGSLKGMDWRQPARRSAHAPHARMLRHLSKKSTRWRIRVCAHANAGCSFEAATVTSEHGRGPSERAVSLAQ